MRHLYLHKVKILMLLILVAALSLGGCGKKTPDVIESEATTEDDKAVSEAIKVMEDDKAEEESPEETVEYTMPAEAVSSEAFIIGDKVYFIGTHEISTMELATGKSEVLWTNEADHMEISTYSTGHGILLYDKIYFYNEYEAGNDYLKKLQVINVDGSDYKVIDTFAGSIYCTGDMYYRDGILYVDGNGEDDCYAIDDKGNITKTITRGAIAEYAANAEEREYVSYVYGNGRMRYSLATVLDNKKMIIRKDGEEFIYDIASGRETSVGGEVIGANKDILLVCEYQEENDIYGTISLKSGQYTYLFRADEGNRTFIGMDEKFAYNYISDDEGVTFYKMNLINGNENEIYRYELTDTTVNDYIVNYCSPTIVGNYLFTAESHDYAMYLQAVNLDDGSVQIMDRCYYDTGISKLGKLVKRKEEYKAGDGTVLITARSSVLNLDSKYAGAKAINDIINKQANVVFDELEDNKDDVDEYYGDVENFGDGTPGYFPAYFFDISSEEITYFDGKILSFLLDGYDYFGGAHGSPFRYPYIFNVDTGRRFKLADIVTVSEEEFKQIAKEEFMELTIPEENSMFWGRAEVSDYIDMYLNFEFQDYFFREDGIVLYFYPYVIAAYAQGFPEVTIPFDKLGIDLKAMAEDKMEETEEESEVE